MLYRTMPKTGDRLSILGFGCMRLAGKMWNPNEPESIKQIRKAIDAGVNYIDTAWPYHGGKSEGILGKALKDGYRAKVKVADKQPHYLCKTREDMDYYLDEQLKRLDDMIIDYYLIHAIDGSIWKRSKELGVIDFFEKAKASGKIRHAGFSFHGSRDEFKEIIDGYDWDFCQIQFNILDEHDQAGVEGLEYAASKNIGVIVMEPLRGGALAGKLPRQVQRIYDQAQVKRSNAEWALRWIWNHHGIVTVLSGMNSEDQIVENVRIASEAEIGSLTNAELRIISEAGKAFQKAMKIPCTGCQYCMPCPQNINIPYVFSIYNNKYLFNQRMMSRLLYVLQCGGIQGKKPGLASQCVSCGLCIKHCPQGIDVPGQMERIKKEFEDILFKPLKFIVAKAFDIGKGKKKTKPTEGDLS
jgi:uncharacterized protein